MGSQWLYVLSGSQPVGVTGGQDSRKDKTVDWVLHPKPTSYMCLDTPCPTRFVYIAHPNDCPLRNRAYYYLHFTIKELTNDHFQLGASSRMKDGVSWVLLLGPNI